MSAELPEQPPTPNEEQVLELLERAAMAPPSDSLPAEVDRWVAASLRRYVGGGGTLGFAEAFGVRGARGFHSLAKRLQYVKRAAALAAVYHTLDADLGVYKRCEIIELEIERFSEWPAWRAAGAPPAGSSVLRCALFRLFSAYAVAGKEPPKKAAAIYAALTRAHQLT